MQERFIGFKHPITSFGANKKYSGIMAANVYRGFDRISNILGLTFVLDHSITGEVFTNMDLSLSNRLGAWMTRQGVVVKEDTAIPLTLVTNASNAFERIDLLIGRHNHDILQVGGIAASYEIIKGADGGPTVPNIPNPETATVLGRFIVASSASSMASVTWKRNRAPSLGGEYPALLEYENRYTDQQQWNQNAVSLQIGSVDYEIAQRGTILALDKGNLFRVTQSFGFLDLLPNKPNGTIVSIKFDEAIIIRSFVENLVGGVSGIGQRAGYLAGLRGIALDNTSTSLTVKRGQIVTFQKIDSQLAWGPGATIPQYDYGDYWKILSVSSDALDIRDLNLALGTANGTIATHTAQIAGLTTLINNIHVPREIVDVDYIGNFNADFDSTGKAYSTSAYYGRAICNGQNATPDYRGRMRVSYSDIDVDYSSVGFIGGNKFVTIAKTNLPTDRLTFNYKWNDWRGTSNSANFGTMSAIDPNNPSGEGFNRTGRTSPMGDGTPLDARPSYKVTLTLMWVGIP